MENVNVQIMGTDITFFSDETELFFMWYFTRFTRSQPFNSLQLTIVWELAL